MFKAAGAKLQRILDIRKRSAFRLTKTHLPGVLLEFFIEQQNILSLLAS